jgi:hypothetical protein
MPATLAVPMTQLRIPPRRKTLGWVSLFAGALLGLLAAPNASAAPCHSGKATGTLVSQPTSKIAWRAELLHSTSVYGTPRASAHPRGSVAPGQASWLLVLGATRALDGRCWVKVRLPTRPNDASGWLHVEQLLLRPSAWSITVSLAKRTLTVFRSGRVARRASVVIGAPATPTPRGLFSIIGAWRSPPNSFLGSWILPLTAHSNALQEFEGGDGTVGVHGRGGVSLLDPLGSARSHGCIRLANAAIDWLVHSVGAAQLAGIPVRVQ